MREQMRDAAFATNISQSWTGAVAGYYGGPNAFHVWAAAGWKRFAANRKLPIWVAGNDGAREGSQAVRALRRLGVPSGVFTAVDMETRVDQPYLAAFGHALQETGYRVWVYGSASSVFRNPALNGYWVADYAGIGPFMYDHVQVRATQYASGQEFDSSTVKHWSYYSGPWWK
jgi:hypothetical protein